MRGFLRFVGVIELIGYVFGAILIPISIGLSGITILYYVLYLVFAPTIGCLCFSVASLLDDVDALTRHIKKLEKKLNVVLDPKDSIENIKEGYDIFLTCDYSDLNGHVFKKGTLGKTIYVDGNTIRADLNYDGSFISVTLDNNQFEFINKGE